MRQKREKMRLLVGGGTLVLRKWTSVVTDRVHWAWVSDLIAYIDFKSSITDSWQALAAHCWKPLCVCAFLCNRCKMILKLNPGFPPKPVARNSRDLILIQPFVRKKIQYSLMGQCLLDCALINCPVQLMHVRPEFTSYSILRNWILLRISLITVLFCQYLYLLMFLLYVVLD